jgi:hypothetical protein
VTTPDQGPEAESAQVKGERASRAASAVGSREARRRAALILEVLAGQRTPTDAATVLGVSVPRFYSLEAQALDGLVMACEPRRRGRPDTPERELAALKKEVARMEREHARSRALLRLAHRTVGVPPPAKGRGPEEAKRKRKPSIRALRAAAALSDEAAPLNSEIQGEKTP